MENYVDYINPEFNHNIEKTRKSNKWSYAIYENGITVHQSYLYDHIFLLNALNKTGPVIGDCFTNKLYRGQSIYPTVINRIAKEVLKDENQEVFMVVNRDNIISIKGIEKAGFVIFASLIGKRWLWFYLENKIKYYI
jgi:RimJ/RimL family protein N-acetyltransferase